MAKTESEIFDEIQDLIVRMCGVRKHEIKIESRLEEDLSIYGDDTFDLLVAYSKKFNVDLSRFVPKDYIAPEGLDVLGTILPFLHKSKHVRKGDITVLNLIKGVACGYLDASVIENSERH